MRVARKVALSAATVAVLGSVAGCGLGQEPTARTAPGSRTSADQTRPGRTAAALPPGPATSSGQPAATGSGKARPATKRPQAGSSTGPSLPPGSFDDNTGTTTRPPKSQKLVLASLPGKQGAGCVAAGDQRDVRSGPLAMGDFAEARAQFRRTKGAYDAAPSNFYVIPRDRDTRRVEVTLTPLTGPGTPIQVVSRQVEDAAQWRYFPISVKIPSPGTWRFTVTAGGQRGCFEADFRA